MKTNRGAESDQIAVGVGGARKKQTQTESDSSPCIRGTGQVGALHQSFFGIPMRSTQLVVQSFERIHKGDCGRSKESTMKLNEASISTFCLSSTMWKEKLLQQPFETANSSQPRVNEANKASDGTNAHVPELVNDDKNPSSMKNFRRKHFSFNERKKSIYRNPLTERF